MAEVLHYSRSRGAPGVQGPMLTAPPSHHPGLPPAPAAPTAAPWVPASPRPPHNPAEAGIRHKQVEAFVGAAAAAAAAQGGAEGALSGPRRRTPSGVAAPYQKAAAQRAAERALRPWDPVAGLGERLGAQLLQGGQQGLQAGQGDPLLAPSLFAPPDPAAAAAVAAAAGRVARGGQGQAAAAGAYSVQPGAPPRELWAVGAAAGPPKYCTACRGGHDPAKALDPSWQPYSPATRLANLQLLDSRFKRALHKGLLLFSPGGEGPGQPLRWRLQPAALSAADFTQQLVLACEGLREGHEPHRFLATRAAEELLDCPRPAADPRVGGSLLAAAAPELVAPLKLCLNTLQPQLVGGALLLMRRLLRSHPSVPPALAPRCRHLLPALALFRGHRTPLLLPAPGCVAPAGTFAGRADPAASRRSCRDCGAPLQRCRRGGSGAGGPGAGGSAAEQEEQERADAAAAARAERLPGRTCARHTLADLIEEVLGLLVGGGGAVAQRVVRSYIPTFTYFVGPQDRPAGGCWEEQQQQQWEQQQAEAEGEAAQRRRRRPRSAPRPAVQRPAAASAAAVRPATAAAGGRRGGGGGGEGRKDSGLRPRRHSGGGGGDGGAGSPPAPGPWRHSSALSAADLARWDGMQFVELPYQPGGAAAAGGGGGDGGDGDVRSRRGGVRHRCGGAAAGGGGDGGGAMLRVSTPVPVFDSPHDPLFRRLAAERAAEGEAAYRGATFARAGGPAEAGRRGGGGGGRPRGNVGAEVAFKDSPLKLRLGF